MNRPLPIVALLLFAASPAFAHAFLETAVPRVGSVITASPSEIRLTFTEVVRPGASEIDLTDAQGTSIELGALERDPKNPAVLVAALKQALSPGIYRVSWRVTAFEGHRTKGDFTFEFKP